MEGPFRSVQELADFAFGLTAHEDENVRTAAQKLLSVCDPNGRVVRGLLHELPGVRLGGELPQALWAVPPPPPGPPPPAGGGARERDRERERRWLRAYEARVQWAQWAVSAGLATPADLCALPAPSAESCPPGSLALIDAVEAFLLRLDATGDGDDDHAAEGGAAESAGELMTSPTQLLLAGLRISGAPLAAARTRAALQTLYFIIESSSAAGWGKVVGALRSRCGRTPAALDAFLCAALFRSGGLLGATRAADADKLAVFAALVLDASRGVEAAQRQAGLIASVSALAQSLFAGGSEARRRAGPLAGALDIGAADLAADGGPAAVNELQRGLWALARRPGLVGDFLPKASREKLRRRLADVAALLPNGSSPTAVEAARNLIKMATYLGLAADEVMRSVLDDSPSTGAAGYATQGQARGLAVSLASTRPLRADAFSRPRSLNPRACPSPPLPWQVFFENCRKELAETLSFQPKNTVPVLVRYIFPAMLDAVGAAADAGASAGAEPWSQSQSQGGQAAAAMRVLEEMLEQARLSVFKAATAQQQQQVKQGKHPPRTAGPPSFANSRAAELGKAVVAALDGEFTAAAEARLAAAPGAAAAAAGEEALGVSFVLRLLDRLVDLERLLRLAAGGNPAGGCAVAQCRFLAAAFPRLLESKALHGTARQPLGFLPQYLAVVDAPSDALLAAVRRLKGDTMPLGGAAEARGQGRLRFYVAQREAFLRPAKEAALSGRGSALVRYLAAILDILRADTADPSEGRRARAELAAIAKLAWQRDQAGAGYAAATAADSTAAARDASAAFALEELACQMLFGGERELVQGAALAGHVRSLGGALLVPLMRSAPGSAAASFFACRIQSLHDVLSSTSPAPPRLAAPDASASGSHDAAAGDESPTTRAEKAKAETAAQRKAADEAASYASKEAAREAAAALVRVMYHRLSKSRLDEGPGKQLPQMHGALSNKLKLQMQRSGLPVRQAAYAAFGALVCATQDAAKPDKRKFFLMCVDGTSLFGERGWEMAVATDRPVRCKMVLRVQVFGESPGGGRGGSAAAGNIGSRKLALGSAIEAGSLADTLADTLAGTAQAGGTPPLAAGGEAERRSSGSFAKGSASPEVAEAGGTPGGGGVGGEQHRPEGADTAAAAAKDAAEEDAEAESAQDELDGSPVLRALVRVLEHLAKALSGEVLSEDTDCGSPPEWLQPVARAVGDRGLHGNARLLLVKALLTLHRHATPLLLDGGDGEGGSASGESLMQEGQMTQQTYMAESLDGRSSASLEYFGGGGGHRGGDRRGAPGYSLPAAFAPALVAPVVDALIANPEAGGGRGLHVTLRDFCIALLEWDSAWPPEGTRGDGGPGGAEPAATLGDPAGADVVMAEASSPASGASAGGDETAPVKRPAHGYSSEHIAALKKLLRCERKHSSCASH